MVDVYYYYGRRLLLLWTTFTTIMVGVYYYYGRRLLLLWSTFTTIMVGVSTVVSRVDDDMVLVSFVFGSTLIYFEIEIMVMLDFVAFLRKQIWK